MIKIIAHIHYKVYKYARFYNRHKTYNYLPRKKTKTSKNIILIVSTFILRRVKLISNIIKMCRSKTSEN